MIPPPLSAPVSSTPDETFSRLPTHESDEDLPLLQLSVLSKRNNNETSRIRKPRAPRLTNSHLSDDDYKVPPPTEASDARSYSFSEELFFGKKRQHLNVDSNTSFELSTARPRYQTIFGSAPALTHTLGPRGAFENTSHKPALLRLEDNTENVKEKLEHWHSELDQHAMTGSLAFCPTGELRSDTSYRIREDFSRKEYGGNNVRNATKASACPPLP